MKNIIELDQVGMVYETGSGSVEALRDITLTVREGEFISLVGPSGCGKSTLLRVTAGLRPMTSGSVVVDGVSVTKPIQKVGMVFQSAVLLKWRSILDNVLLPAELAGLNPRKYRDRARELLELVGLGDFTKKSPNELSGGMQQRAALCRALLLDPPLLLMDEPFGALDEITRDKLNEELLRIWRETGTTIMFVTHSIPEAAFLGQHVLVLASHPGRVKEFVTVDLPAERRLAMRDTLEFVQITAHLRRLLEEC